MITEKNIYFKKATTLYLYITRCYSKPIIISVRKHFSFRMQEKNTHIYTNTHCKKYTRNKKKKKCFKPYTETQKSN